jgi:hypothetical protein
MGNVRTGCKRSSQKKSHYSHYLSFNSRRSTSLLGICGVNGDLRNEVLDQDADSRVAQKAFILFSTFLDLRPVSAGPDLQTLIYGWL